MTSSTGYLNLRWTKILIDQLIQQGIDYFCLSPGSRVTPLTLAVAEHPLAKKMIHFDERALAFHALGYAKGAQKAAVLIVTSGTAVGNLLPALMEAHNDRIPLIVLTSDRPPELHECGANQTSPQSKIFSDFVRWQFDLPCPTEEIPDRFLATTLAQAVLAAHQTPSGPVHINCMFREPLFTEKEILDTTILPTHLAISHPIPPLEALEQAADLLKNAKQGVIVVGSLKPQSLEEVITLSSQLKWPILPDIISQIRCLGEKDEVIEHYDAILKASDTLRPDTILHLGDRLVSKTMQEWLVRSTPSRYLHVSDHPMRQDPFHQATHRIQSPVGLFCDEMTARLPENKDREWFNLWKERSTITQSLLHQILSSKQKLTEPGLLHCLYEQINSEWALFLSNSMPVRDADQFYFPKNPTGPIFCNRGVSGIDGNISTAIGIAEGCQKPTLALLGDLASLHDLNALAQLRSSRYPVMLVIINNQGGGIFSFLPISQKKTVFEDFFATSHPYSFDKAAELFQIPYHCPSSFQEWNNLLSSHLTNPRSALIEIKTDRSENLLCHQAITAQVRKCLELSIAVI